MTWATLHPPAETHDAVGFHGTTSENLSAMQRGGVKASNTGRNFGGGSQGGPGLYTTTERGSAELFAAQAVRGSGEAVSGQVASIYRKKEARPVSRQMPDAAFGRRRAQRELHEAEPRAHEFSLGPTRLPATNPARLPGRGGTTTLLTQHALEDPGVEYVAVPHEPIPRAASAARLESLTPEDQKKWKEYSESGKKAKPGL